MGASIVAKPISGKSIFALLVIVVFILCMIVGIAYLKATFNKTAIVTSSQLKKVVEIDQLSTVEIHYTGIADVKDDDGDIAAHAYYEASVRVNVAMDDIDFQIDHEKKLVRPVIPEFEISTPVINDRSIKYFERNPQVSIQRVVVACQEDARVEIDGEEKLLRSARKNLKATIEALISPLVEGAGYTVTWQEVSPEPSEESPTPSQENTILSGAPEPSTTGAAGKE